MLASFFLIALAFSSLTISLADSSANITKTNAKILLLRITGGIGPAMQMYVEQGLDEAQKIAAKAVVLQIDTPGGLGASMRGIIKAMLASKVPVFTYVAPGGARAASAGTFIVYASSFAAMAPGTHIGAATPVSVAGGGSQGKKDKSAPESGDSKADNSRESSSAERQSTTQGKAVSQATAMRQKVTNDSVAFIRSLAQMHGRDIDFAERSVIDAATLTAKEALQKKVINAVAKDRFSMLRQAQGARILVAGNSMTFRLGSYVWQDYQPTWNIKFLQVITNPAIAYFLLMAGIYGLFLEFTHPGTMIPGVIGGICLLLGLYALQLLPINYAGLSLLIFGVALMIGEAFIPQIGVMGIGGVIAFAVGSFMLLDTQSPTFMLAKWLIILLSIISAAFFIVVGRLAMRSRRQAIVSGVTPLIGCTAMVEVSRSESGVDMFYVFLQSERWRVSCEETLHQGDLVRVIAVEGVVLKVVIAPGLKQ